MRRNSSLKVQLADCDDAITVKLLWLHFVYMLDAVVPQWTYLYCSNLERQSNYQLL